MRPQPVTTNTRADFYARIDHHSMAPLWEVLGNLVTREPRTPALPYLWNYATVRPYILEAGELITAKEAERRVLVLENPGLRGQSSITHTLYAGLQLILPGEIAPAHRHTQSALRFIIEGRGAYTAVDGERTIMQPGDFVITPSWTYHDHGNDSDQPMVWLDGLDVPLVSMLDASFAEHFPEDRYPEKRPVGDSPARYGSGLMPVDYKPAGHASPVFNYPYEKSRETLERLKSGPLDACHGIKLKYVNPVTGGYAMPTIGSFIQLLPKGFQGAPYRSTDGTVFAVIEGKGRTVVGDQLLEWGPRDVFVVPSWATHHHEARDEAVLFSFSDRPVQEKLELWREQRSAA